MDLSVANTALWNPILSFGILAGVMLLSNALLRKVEFLRKTLIPTAVLSGFIVLALRAFNWLPITPVFLETITYHSLALGFIAMSLRVPTDTDPEFRKELTGLKSGAVIIGAYLVQGIAGLAITLLLSYTLCPGLFQAAGLLLPMGYGQGPGQANNVGSTYQALGFVGGQSFGLSIAAAGYLCACTVGVIYLAVLRKRGTVVVAEPEHLSGSTTVDTFQQVNEIPISESVDRFSVQIALVIMVYLLAFLASWGITALISALSPGLANTLNPLIWGFNFIIGSLMAMLCRSLFKVLTKAKVMTHQYPNNYLLNRISGATFDFMIICGIASIDFSDLQGLWIPFLFLAIAGAILTIYYLQWVCRKVYPNYYYEGFFSMYGMLTGTISSGVLLLREIDPFMKTPAANNLLAGSSFGILLGAPMLVLIGIAPQSTAMAFLTLGLMLIYFAAMALIIFKVGGREKKTQE